MLVWHTLSTLRLATPLLPPSAMHTPPRACMTRRRVVALLQSLESSRHRMMYSFCSIFMRTMASTCGAGKRKAGQAALTEQPLMPGAGFHRQTKQLGCTGRRSL